MIGMLRGRVIDVSAEGVALVEVAGVGFEVHVPSDPGTGEDEVTVLHVETVVREDSITLYGFPSRAHRSAFALLRKVKNIGPRLAMSILRAHAPEDIACALAQGDTRPFEQVSGIGKKTAQLIVVELRDKVRKLERSSGARTPPLPARLTELISALEHLGFRPDQAREAALAVQAAGDEDTDLQDLIRRALEVIA